MRLNTATRRGRRLSLGLGCLVALAALPGGAAAQTSTSTFAIKQFFITLDGKTLDSDIQLNSETVFNRARCACTANQRRVRVEIEITTDRNNATESFFVVAGANCLDSESRIVQDAAQCALVASGRIADQETNIVFDTTVRQMMPGGCTPNVKSLALTVYAGQDQTLARKLEPALTYSIDGQAPTPPVKSKDPTGGENLVSVDFKAGSTSEQDVRYQLLCARLVDGAVAGPWRSVASTTAIFSSAATACAGASGADAGVSSAALTDADAAVADAAVADAAVADAGGATTGAADAGVADASSAATGAADAGVGSGSDGGDSTSAAGLLEDPRYLCSGSITTPGSLQIAGLTNGQAYRFYAVAVDSAGNASALVDLGSATPAVTQDLWERYIALGGKGRGGYGCATTATTTRGGFSLLLLGCALLLLAARRGRRLTRPDRRRP
ncbi:MAG: hypothetical protein IPL40_12715 [Proteobacteria bacterium]|nr:hypothetical protein [Pseudomonadota bacterium]